MQEYTLNMSNIDDTGEVARPDGSKVRSDRLHIKRDGEYVRVSRYEYAHIILDNAYCSCGEPVIGDTVCLLLEDESVLYPAKCCNSATFFDNIVKVMRID